MCLNCAPERVTHISGLHVIKIILLLKFFCTLLTNGEPRVLALRIKVLRAQNYRKFMVHTGGGGFAPPSKCLWISIILNWQEHVRDLQSVTCVSLYRDIWLGFTEKLRDVERIMAPKGTKHDFRSNENWDKRDGGRSQKRDIFPKHALGTYRHVLSLWPAGTHGWQHRRCFLDVMYERTDASFNTTSVFKPL